MTTRRALILCALLAACEGGSTSPPPDRDPTFTLLTAAQWSGGEVEVESAAFADLLSLPIFTVGGDTLRVARASATVLRVTLPDLSSGPVALVLHDLADSLTVGTVQVYGLGHAASFPGGIGYDASVVPGVRPRFIGKGGGGVAVLDPATGTEASFTGLGPLIGTDGIGVGYDPNRFVLRDSTGLVGTWALFPTKSFLDTVPPRMFTAEGIAQLGDSVWMTWSGDIVQTITRTRTMVYSDFVNDAERVIMSPRGDLATVARVSDNQEQIPVVESATGLPRFVLSGIVVAKGAAFSPTGDTLFVSSWRLGEDSLVLIATADGARLGGVALPDSLTSSNVASGYVAVDPRNDRLYMLDLASGKRVVLVMNRRTLAVEAVLRCPTPCPVGFDEMAILALDTVADRLWATGRATPAPLIGFDLLP